MSDHWGVPPRKEDLHALVEAAATMPAETEARLMALRYELCDCAETNPKHLAQFAFMVEQGRSIAARQVEAALRILAERQTCIELHQQRDTEQLEEIRRLRQRVAVLERGRPWWLRWLP